MNQKARIIVFTYSIPMPDKSSGERRFVGILETLAKKYDVDLCIARFGTWLLSKKFQSYIPPLEMKGINVLPITKNTVKESVKRKKYDIGFFEFYWIAEETMHTFLRYQPHAATIVDSVDVHFAREESQAKLGLIKKRKARITKRRELMMYRLADISVVVSKEDFKLLHDKEKVGVVHMGPNVVATVERIDKKRDPIAIFIGSYLWPPNEDAVVWFVNEIWPFVISSLSEAKLLIIGSDPTERVMALSDNKGIDVLGFVPETKLYLDKAAVSIAPMRYGGGMKGKVNEALAHGLPVITTSIGAQGFHPENGREMIVEDDPESFAAALVDVFNNHDKQVEMGKSGQKLNESLCSPEVVEAYLETMIQDAIIIKSSRPVKIRRTAIIKISLNLFWNKTVELSKKVKKKLLTKFAV